MRQTSSAQTWVGLVRTTYRLAIAAILTATISQAPALSYVTTTVNAGRGPVTVYVPNVYTPAAPLPLVLLLHGYSIGGGQAAENYFHFLLRVDTRLFIYAFPDGRTNQGGNRFWTATDACCNLFNQGGPDDDSIYLRNLIAEIQAVLSVDRQRIFVVGHSNGGFMAHRMACDHADTIAAIVSLEGATFADPSSCSARQPVHVLEIHGTSDDTILYDGGNLFGVPYPGAVTTTKTWASLNGCDDSLVVLAGHLNLAGGTVPESDVFRYTATCNVAGSAEHWRISGVDGTHVPALSSNFTDLVLTYLYTNPKQTIRFDDASTLSWQAVVGAQSYNVYRGQLTLVDGDGDGLPDGGYGGCVSQLDPDMHDTSFTDTTVPEPGAAFFYLLGYTDSGFGQQGGVGVTSSGQQRSSPLPCP